MSTAITESAPLVDALSRSGGRSPPPPSVSLSSSSSSPASETPPSPPPPSPRRGRRDPPASPPSPASAFSPPPSPAPASARPPSTSGVGSPTLRITKIASAVRSASTTNADGARRAPSAFVVLALLTALAIFVMRRVGLPTPDVLGGLADAGAGDGGGENADAGDGGDAGGSRRPRRGDGGGGEG